MAEAIVVPLLRFDPVEFWQDPYTAKLPADNIDPIKHLAIWAYSIPEVTTPFGDRPARAIVYLNDEEILNEWLTPSLNPDNEGWAYVVLDESLMADATSAVNYAVRLVTIDPFEFEDYTFSTIPVNNLTRRTTYPPPPKVKEE